MPVSPSLVFSGFSMPYPTGVDYREPSAGCQDKTDQIKPVIFFDDCDIQRLQGSLDGAAACGCRMESVFLMAEGAS
jgi:hypothetical protein